MGIPAKSRSGRRRTSGRSVWMAKHHPVCKALAHRLAGTVAAPQRERKRNCACFPRLPSASRTRRPKSPPPSAAKSIFVKDENRAALSSPSRGRRKNESPRAVLEVILFPLEGLEGGRCPEWRMGVIGPHVAVGAFGSICDCPPLKEEHVPTLRRMKLRSRIF
jgi:hypothetical protein